VFIRPTISRRTEAGDLVPIIRPEDARSDYQIWLRELSCERCVWCWNRFKKSSHALWRLYGDRGIALHSTVGKVKSALLNAKAGSCSGGVQRGIVAPVAYINLERNDADPVLSSDGNIFLPHLLKSAEFDYEEEIRFILGANHDVLNERKGVMLQIDPLLIVSDFRVSPYIRQEERDSVSRFVEDALERLRSGPSPEPLGLGEDWISAYGQVGPFTSEDKPPAGFRDLDRFHS
jgi:hypothetical protein